MLIISKGLKTFLGGCSSEISNEMRHSSCNFFLFGPHHHSKNVLERNM